MMETCEQLLLLLGVLGMAVSSVNAAGSMITLGSEQFKLFNSQNYTWEEAKQKCTEEGMVMAEPKDPATLVKHLRETHGHYVWFGARGNGIHFLWNSGTVLPSSSKYWYDGQPTVDQLNQCLSSFIIDEPYYAILCGIRYAAICQFDVAAAPKVDGVWSSYSDWSICLSTCKKTRKRSCTNPAPQNGGQECSGDQTEIQSCTDGNCIECKPGFDNYAGYCLHPRFYGDDGKGLTWDKGDDYCRELGGTMAYPPTTADLTSWQTAIQEAISTGSYWVGARQQQDGIWTWVDGTQVQPAAWAEDQPTGRGQCGFIFYWDGTLADGKCASATWILCQARPIY